MIRLAFIFQIGLLLFQFESYGQNQPWEKRNLQKEWLIFNGKDYVAFDQHDEPVNTIYIALPYQSFKGDYIQIEAEKEFSVFVNRQLYIESTGIQKIYVDSLFDLQSPILIAINQKGHITKQNLSIKVFTDISKGVENLSHNSPPRRPTYFRDFVITATLLLFIFLILIIQLNPRLSYDYFSIHKIFSLRETDDDQFYLRITSANILFYAFTSMILGLFLLVIHEHVTIEFGFSKLSSSSFFESLLMWMQVSTIILAILFLKIILVLLISFLFDNGDTAGYHFFNFIRALLVVTSILTVIAVGYYMVRGLQESFYLFLFKSFGWAIGLYITMIFFKLSNRVRFTPIHLFSYICATEIIPILTIVKLLYK